MPAIDHDKLPPGVMPQDVAEQFATLKRLMGSDWYHERLGRLVNWIEQEQARRRAEAQDKENPQ